MNVVDIRRSILFCRRSKYRKISKPIETIDQLIVPNITLTEVFKNILRQRNEEAALIAIAHMEQVTIISLDNELAINAASLGVKFKLPLVDSIICNSPKI